MAMENVIVNADSITHVQPFSKTFIPQVVINQKACDFN
jgi:hypothetical protein